MPAQPRPEVIVLPEEGRGAHSWRFTSLGLVVKAEQFAPGDQAGEKPVEAARSKQVCVEFDQVFVSKWHLSIS
jgi:hypothetical protein